MKISKSNQISLTKSILFEFLIKRSAKLGTRPPSLWKSNGVAIPSMRRHGSKKTDFGNLIPNYLESSMCTHKPPTHFVQYFFINSKWLSQNLKNFCCWMLHVLRKPTSSCAVSGHFSCLADSPAFCRGQSAVQKSKSTREPAICVFQLKSPADGPVFTSGRSAVVSKIVPEPS